jgi:phosphonopyruvate decarboxylase
MTVSVKLDPKCLLNALASFGLFDFVGVPDSTLEPLIKCLSGDSRFGHMIATNECEAVSVAMGQYLGSGVPSVVYLQSSGFGKTVHPITSLLCGDICNIPVLLIIGHRGHPRVKDEPQHKCLGRILPRLLETLEIPFLSLEGGPEEIEKAVQVSHRHLTDIGTPFALLVPPDLFLTSKKESAAVEKGFTRAAAIAQVVNSLPSRTRYVSTTGKISRELYFLRGEQGSEHDFYTVGGMGCASSIALGVAKKCAFPICVLDGDGASLMQLGSWASIGVAKPLKYVHVVLDNESYESTGGQPSLSPFINLLQIAAATGYRTQQLVHNSLELGDALNHIQNVDGPHMIVVKVSCYSDPQLGRPSRTPKDNGNDFKNSILKEHP